MATSGVRALSRPSRRLAASGHPILAKFLADRGPHLAAMVAYYALLSLVPFLFMLLSALGLLGRQEEGSAVIRELRHVLPGQSVNDLVSLVTSIQRNAGTLGVIGFVGMLWASLGFYSALESALNIVYRVQNRPFFRGKALTFALVLASLLALFVGLLAITAATGWVDRHTADVDVVNLGAAPVVASVALSTAATFGFLYVVYRYLTNARLTAADVWPGAVAGTLLFQVSFSALPLYLRFSDQLAAFRAFGGFVIMLVWLYLMANIVVLGAEINWRHRTRRHPESDEITGLA